MNILQVLPRLQLGGVERGVIDLAVSLKQLGHKSVVISSGGELVEELEKAGVIHYRIGVEKKSLPAVLMAVPRIVQVIKKEEIDIVHARSRVPALSAFLAARKTGSVFITTCHGYYSTHLFSRIMARGRFVIVPSQVIGRHMTEDLNVSPERIKLIERSVNLEKFYFKSIDDRNKTQPIIANISRLTSIKGHSYFLRCLPRILRVMPHIKVWIVGDGDSSYKTELEILTRRLGLSHCVKFLGQRNDIPALLTKVNVAVLSTVTKEAFGRVIIEAQASGVPVVATKVGGVSEIIEDNVNGILVPAKDPESMARAILNILKDNKLARDLSLNGRKSVEERYTLSGMVDKTLKVYKQALETERILLIKLSALGDILLIGPSLKAIREKFPKARIYCLTSPAGSKLLKNCPYIDEMIIYDHKSREKGVSVLLKTAARLRSINFDKVIDFQNTKRTQIISFLSLAPDRFGFSRGMFSFLINHRADYKKNLPALKQQAQILKLADIELKDEYLEFWADKHDEEFAQDLFAQNWIKNSQGVVGVHIGASSSWQTKIWPSGSLKELIEILSKENIRVLLFGSDADEQRLEKIVSGCKGKPVSLAGKLTLQQLYSVMKRTGCVLTGDSLPLHMAAAAGVPFVALFGPTDPKRHMPPAKRFIVIRKDLECSPCYKRSCSHHSCMKSINAKEVFQAMKSLI